MKEQDIRRVLQDVCESLDRHCAKVGPLAAGITMAMLLNCSSPPETEYGTQMVDTGADVSTDSPAVRYGAMFDAFAGDADAGADTTDTTVTSFDAAYMAPFDTSIADSSDADADAAEDGADADADAPTDLGGAALYAVIMDSQTQDNEGG